MHLNEESLELFGGHFVKILKEDEIFVEYFNDYLALSIFKQKLQWDVTTLSFNFQQINKSACSRKLSRISSTRHSSRHFRSQSATNRNLIQWISVNRLPFFRNSDFFREYKLYVCLSGGLVSNSEGTGNRQSSQSSLKFPSEDGELPQAQVLVRHQSSKGIATRTSLPPIAAATLNRTKSLPCLKKEDSFVHNENEDVEDRWDGSSSQCESGRTSVLEFNIPEGTSSNTSDVKEGNGHMDVVKHFFRKVVEIRDLIRFLHNIEACNHLLELWFMIEKYFDNIACDTMGYDMKAKRLYAYRFIQEHFSTHLTVAAKIFLTKSLSNEHNSGEFLQQAQQDVFERLQQYWLPRYILHKENNAISMRPVSPLDEALFPTLSCVETLSLVKSFPLVGEDFKDLIRDKGFDQIATFLHQEQQTIEVDSVIDEGLELVDSKMILTALHLERESGAPFSQWLQSNRSADINVSLFFILDYFDLLLEVENVNDRLLNLCTVWKFFQKYCSHDSKVDGIREENVAHIKQIRTELSSKRKISQKLLSDLFKDVQKTTLKLLEPYWKDYYNQDVFIDYQEPIRRIDENIRAESEMSINEAIFYRPSTSSRNVRSALSDRRSRLHTAITIAERCSSIRERRRLRPSLQRPRQSSVKDLYMMNMGVNKDESDDDNNMDDSDSDSDDDDEKDFLDNVENAEMMASFKAFIQDNEGRDLMNDLLMYLEIESYFSLFGASRAGQRHTNSMAIHKTFFEKSSRKCVVLPGALLTTVRDERPTSGVLREAQQFVLPQLSTSFDAFFKYSYMRERRLSKAEFLIGKSTNNLMSTSTLATGQKKWKDLTTVQNAVKELKQKKKKIMPDREAVSSRRREYKQIFLSITSNLVVKCNQDIIDRFHKFILRYTDIGFPRMGKNLLFYIEVVKFKEVFQSIDERFLQKKGEVIVDVFLDSASPPWLQVDVSPEVASRVSQKVQNLNSSGVGGGKRHLEATIFDDAHNMVLKELLPFWNAFSKTTKEGIILSDNKSEKRQKKSLVKFKERLSPIMVKEPSTKTKDKNNYLSFSLLRGYKWKDVSSRRTKPKPNPGKVVETDVKRLKPNLGSIVETDDL